VRELAHRPITADDRDLMWDLVYCAAHVAEEADPSRETMQANPDLIRHVIDWGRHGDLGIIAEHYGVVVGGAWLRLHVGAERELPYYVDEFTPELVIAVLPGTEGRGIGSETLTELLARAVGRYPRVMLTVRSTNPAVRLYERFGFSEIKRLTNRVGTTSVEMHLPLGS
jgi:GNAT superfamily N-acetyltransferase